MTRTVNEWLDWYEAHGGSKDLELDGRETVLFQPERGFVSFFIHDGILELHHMCGDGKFWRGQLAAVMRKMGLTRLRATTRRNPRAWMRKYGGRVLEYYMEASLDELEV